MRLHRDLHSLPADARGCVVALGNFDGVHRGHQAVIGAARAIARRDGVPLAVLTFEPHPRTLFNPGDPPFRLTPLRPKLRLLGGLGVDVALVVRFTRRLSLMPAESFARDVLIGQLAAHHIVVGHDYVFGHQRRGTPELLGGVAREGGFAFTCVDPVTRDGAPEVLSSTLVRRHLRSGDPAAAAEILGRPWEIEGRVRGGRRLGRTIGVPTANIALGAYLRPAFGVYACRAAIEEPGAAPRWIDAVANIGNRPTVDGTTELLEVHLFDFAGDLYGRRLRVALTAFLRPEEKFDGLAAMQAQIARDLDNARRVLATAPVAG
jgi:riboflavin kinase/FMN adenylyltransferase